MLGCTPVSVPRAAQRGQAITELALLLPTLLAVAVLSISGGQVIDGAVQLAGAGKAAGSAASTDIRIGQGNGAASATTTAIETDAALAANQEQGNICPASPKCIAVAATAVAGAHGTPLEQLVLSQTIRSAFPNVPGVLIRVTVVVSA